MALLDGFVKAKITSFEQKLDRIIELLEVDVASRLLNDDGLTETEVEELLSPRTRRKRG